MNLAIEILGRYLSRQKVTLVDVGALGGIKSPWLDMRSLLCVIGFDPQDGAIQTVRKESGDVLGSVAIGAESGIATLHITQKLDNSSLLFPNHEFTNRLAVKERFVINHEESVNVMPLDEWLKKEGVSSVDFLKIDTQGTEGDVLRGANYSLTSVLGLDVEVNFAERYQGQAYFSDVDEKLRDAGFVLFDLQRRYLKYQAGVRLGGPKGQLTHGTALYLRSIDSFGALLAGSDGESARRHLAAFLMIVTLYGYYDYALEILREYGHVFPEDVCLKISNIFRAQLSLSQRIPRFSIRFSIAKLLSQMACVIKPRSRLGTYGDDELGNI